MRVLGKSRTIWSPTFRAASTVPEAPRLHVGGKGDPAALRVLDALQRAWTGSPLSVATDAVPADGQRVFVGQAGVATSAVPITVNDRGNVRKLCSFSEMAWLN